MFSFCCGGRDTSCSCYICSSKAVTEFRDSEMKGLVLLLLLFLDRSFRSGEDVDMNVDVAEQDKKQGRMFLTKT